MEQFTVQASGSSSSAIRGLTIARSKFLLGLFAFCTLQVANAQDDIAVFPKLAKQITKMKEADQAARKMLGKEFSDSADRDSIRSVVARIDSLHNIKLHQFVDKYGFPTPAMVGMQSTHEFWILIMHQDRDNDLQQSVLKWLESIRSQHDALSRDYAYLHDRISVNKGVCQTYGTQVDFNQDLNRYTPFPICDEKKLKRLRKKMKLMPLERQMEQENSAR